MEHVALALPGSRLALAVAAVAVLAIPWYLVARTISDVKPAPPSPVGASAIVWGGRVFADRAPFAHWLHVHGVAYSVWGGRHPKARVTLAH
jgi:hypothetical protein